MILYKKNSIFLFLAICLFMSHTACYCQTYTEKMTDALKARSKGKIQSAIKTLKEAAQLASSDKQQNMSNLMLGDCLIENEQYAEAAKIYEKILQSPVGNDEKSEAYYNLIKAYSALGNNSKVESNYKKLFSEVPDSPFAELAKAYYANLYGNGAANSIAKSAAKKASPKKDLTTDKKQQNKKDDVKIASSNSTKKNEKSSEDKKIVNPFANKSKESKVSKVSIASKETEKPKNENPKSEKTISDKNMALLKEILSPKNISDSKREELVSSILILQDKLKNGKDNPGTDALLFELAENTADFGEYVEACKNYDKLLNSYPSSKYVEKSYYEAIRLRAILGVNEAVVSWGNAFLKTFPSSRYSDNVKALMEYSKTGGKIQFANVKPSADKKVTAAKNKTKEDLLNDIRYKTASQYMKEGNYEASAKGFKSLTSEYSNVAQIWWDMALVYVQTEDFKSASTAISKMLEIEPNNEDANSLSGYIHYRLENYEEAANAYENVGESEGSGVNFFDAKSASKKMRNSTKNN